MKIHRVAHRAGVPTLPVVFCLFAACGAPEGGDAEGPGEWTVSPEPEVTIGLIEGEAAYLFQEIDAARLLPGGAVAVADGGQSVIRVYGPDGAFRTEMGRPGEGPGEFARLREIWVRAPDTIGAWDPRSRRMSIFLTDGLLVDARGFEPPEGWPGGSLDMFVGAFDDGDVALAGIRAGARTPGEPSRDRMWIERFGPDGAHRHGLGDLAGMRRLNGSPLPFSPFPMAAVHDDTLYITDGLRPEIRVRGPDGAVARIIALPDAGNDPAAARAALEGELRGAEGLFTVARLEEVPESDSIPHVAAMLVDDSGRIWAKRYEPGADALWLPEERGRGGEWWVVEPDGELVATVRLPDGFALLDVRGDRLLGVTRGEMDVERVAVHRVVR